MPIAELCVMLAMVAFNSVFAAYEIALAAVSVGRLRILAAANQRGAAAALYMKENVEASLAAIQIGITLFGAVAAATGGAGAEEVIAPWLEERGLSEGMAELLAIAAVVLPLTGVTIMFGELVPKVFALRNKEWMCLRLSPPMRAFTFAVWPLVWFFETVVTAITDWGQARMDRATSGAPSESAEMQELRTAATLARTSRLLGHREERIIVEAARLASRPMSEIMLPAASVIMLPADASLTQSLIAAHLDMHTRFPITETAGDPQRIIGYVNVKDVIAALHLAPHEPTLKSIMRPLSSFRDTDTISQGLERLLRDSNHIALVRDAAGKVAGMVTLEDVVEELLGDIKDEYDRLPAFVAATGAGWVVGGGVTLARLREATGLNLAEAAADADTDTLNDWLTRRLGRPARGGDSVTTAAAPPARVLVRKVRRQQLLEAQVST